MQKVMNGAGLEGNDIKGLFWVKSRCRYPCVGGDGQCRLEYESLDFKGERSG